MHTRRLLFRTIRTLPACACLLLAAAAATAEEPPAHPLKPLLWKVEGKELETPSWLFGTIDEVIAAYVAGDAERIDAEIERAYRELAESEHAELGRCLMKELIDDRNLKMAAVIVERLAEAPDRSQFFAVGAAHYIGRMNIGQLLEEAGYTVTRVTE